MRTRAHPLTSLLLLALACGGGKGGSDETASGTSEGTSAGTEVPTTSGSSSGGAAGQRPNWHEDIAPLVTENCVSCHYSGGIAPFSMESYADTKDWASLMAFDAAEGLMPPWHGIETPECAPPFPYKHDARLSQEEKDLLQKWSDIGAPEGDPALAAPLPDPPSLDLPSPTKTAAATGSVTVEKVGSTLDFFHCLTIDPGNDQSVYLNGLQVIPGNRAIVHHVLIYVDAAGDSASWPGGVKENCGGGAGVGGGQLIGGWVPGSLPMETPIDVGTELPPGTRLILNVHYHATGAGPETDKGTALALRWETVEPKWVSFFTLIGAPGMSTPLTGPLLIPAGEKDHAEEYEFIVALNGQSFPDIVDVRVWSALNHMHKVGVDMRVWLEDRDSGAETCLLHTPRWDFNWQRSYAFDSPIDTSVRVRAGDKVRIRCVYDNTLDNPGVVEALAEAGLTEPIDVKVGEGTLDEMCLTGIGVAVKNGL